MNEVLMRFENLGRKTLDQAEQIDSTIPEFIEGLEIIIENLIAARDAGVEAHKATSG